MIAPFQKPGPHSGPKACFCILRFNREDSLAWADNFQHVFINYVQGGFVDKADGQALGFEILDNIQAPIQHFTVGDNVSIAAFADQIVFPGYKRIPFTIKALPVGF